MRIVLISDTHGLHRQLDVPNGDMLIHAGDFTMNSKPNWMSPALRCLARGTAAPAQNHRSRQSRLAAGGPRTTWRNHQRHSARGLGRGNRGP